MVSESGRQTHGETAGEEDVIPCYPFLNGCKFWERDFQNGVHEYGRGPGSFSIRRRSISPYQKWSSQKTNVHCVSSESQYHVSPSN